MSRAEFIRFISVLEENSNFRNLFTEAQPEEILKLAKDHGFDFSAEIQGRFLNRWAGVYFCPFANQIGQLCPKLVPSGYKNLLEYSQSTCSKDDKVERFDFRAGGYYEGLKPTS
tara:strand:- start:9 stop:350 length:342 start_codon:yes stop_codon:yes gene_type:complete